MIPFNNLKNENIWFPFINAARDRGFALRGSYQIKKVMITP
jgi:hypothetical protein